jgi:hypothetical protein
MQEVEGYHDDQDRPHFELKSCGTPLYLIRHTSEPIFTGSTDEELNEVGAGWTSSWELSCENGHVLLTSAGEENAEPFQIEYLDALGAGVGK